MAIWFEARAALARVLGRWPPLEGPSDECLTRIARDTRNVRAALQWGYRDALQEYGDLLASLARSIREAAYQGRDSSAGAPLSEARLVLIEAIRVLHQVDI